jgi:4-amino-4-deoxy-L-arabinose transferase
MVATLCFAMLGSFGGVFGGPALGDHEAIVAQSARQMRLSGDWLVPHFLDTAFLRKSPLPFWMVAASSSLFPNDPATGLPVTAAAARLPSAVCSLGSILLLWHLASRMFGRRTGIVTAILASSCVAFLLYAPNATAEMPLTFGCVWAYYHFWFAATARSARGRIVHSIGFYLALGFAMLAKGPAPVALVGFPLAVWWYAHRPLRIAARRGLGAWRQSVTLFARDFLPRTIGVFTQLWFIPGIIIFGLTFVPWMLAVAERHPHAWDLWNWQFLQRAKGDFPDTRHRSIAYYLPILGGLVLPWTFLVIEAAVAPWVRRYARVHKALLFAGLWVLLGTLSMSLMEFKKPYYILPAVPGLILLIAVAAERLFLGMREAVVLQEWLSIRLGVGLQIVALVAAAWMWFSEGEVATPATVLILATGAALLFGLLFWIYRKGHRPLTLGVTAIATVAAFGTVWHGFGKSIDNVEGINSPNARVQRSAAHGSTFLGRSPSRRPADLLFRPAIRTHGRP